MHILSKEKLVVTAMLLITTLWLSGCGSKVSPGMMGLRYRPLTTGFIDKPLQEGFYWHLPWNDVITYSLQWQSFTERVDVLTQDDLHIRIDAAVVIRPVAQEIHHLQLEVGPDYYNQIIRPDFLSVARSAVANYTLVEIPEKSPEIEAKILIAMKDRIQGKHIELNNVAITHIDFTSGLLKAIEAKLTKEQEKIQKDFEIDIEAKAAEIARVRAKGEGDAIMIKAQGEAEALKIRAAAQAEAQKMIDQTLTQRYLQFKAFESPNAKLIYVPTGKEGLPLIVVPEGR